MPSPMRTFSNFTQELLYFVLHIQVILLLVGFFIPLRVLLRVLLLIVFLLIFFVLYPLELVHQPLQAISHLMFGK